MPTGFRSVLFPLGLKSAPTVPTTPGSLTATASPGQVVLTWTAATTNPSAPVTAYKVYRGTTSGGETLLATLGAVLTYTDTAVVGGNAYYYKVSAVNLIGEGSLSSEVSALAPLLAMTGGGGAGPRYSVRLYDTRLQFRAIAPRVAMVDVGRVANDVADGSVEIAPVAGVLLDEIGAVDIWRHEAGRASHVGLYVAETLTAAGSTKTTSWRIGVKSPLVLYAERLSGNLATAETGMAAATIKKLMTDAWRYGDTTLTVAPVCGDGVSPNATTQAGILEPLSTIKSAALAAKTVLGFDLWTQVNFAVEGLPSGTGIALRSVVWAGEYGADRRVGRSSRAVVLYLSRIADKWQVQRDMTREITAIRGSGSAANYKNARALEGPWGNRREKASSGSASGAGRVNSQAQATLAQGRPLKRIQADLALPPDRYGLDLGDAFSVIVDGQLADARLNVIHYSWSSSGESVKGRADVEVYAWS
mgnify:FL=1